MKKSRLIGMCALLLLTAMPVTAQQIIYGSAKALAGGKGDTVTTLHVERRTRNQLYLMGGADYRIESSTNQSLSRYLRKRCYAVRIDSTLYVNCRKMRYKRYRLGGWYASALEIGGHIFYAAQPVGQAATETLTPHDAPKLPGEVGDAIQASGLVNQRVYYELDLETGRSAFVDKERMRELLAEQPELLKEFEKETSEAAEVMEKYLRRLR
ncbi:MAG TPA: hypothetical protein H9785_02975 [Candidatus Bacteroides intestinavium]|uniref:DUF4468 domain-containing protein n=1 Tax=Candidatus Bacteroides intestinavium TaxID=2838469 RepID=A0A9D2HSF2_9BACE|nr:hypothetical protein [Candidatus Bacteroides intestinavium]